MPLNLHTCDVDAELFIMQDSRILMSGDAQSIRVVYNNLTGKNFEGAALCDYIAFMEWSLGLALLPDQLKLAKACEISSITPPRNLVPLISQ